MVEVHLTDTFSLTLGGRYTLEEKDVKVASLGGDRTPDLEGFSYDFIDNDRWDFFSWHGCLNWHPTENFLLYTSLTRSFRSGGYNMRNQLPAHQVLMVKRGLMPWRLVSRPTGLMAG